MILVLASLALAAPPGGAPRVTPGSVGEVRGSLLGGIDLWEGGGGGAGLVRVAGGGATGSPSWRLTGGYAAQLEGISGPTWLDGHTAVVRLRHAGSLQPGVEVAGRGGLAMEPGWGELATSAGVAWASGPLEVDASAGGLVRGGGGARGPGGIASLSAHVGRASTQIGAKASARALGGDLPPWALDADVTLSHRGVLRVGAHAGLSWVAADPDHEEPVAGLALGGTAVARAGLEAHLPITPGLELSLEPGVEVGWGASSYWRGTALVGLSGRVVRASPEPLQPSSGVRFSLIAPRATSVDVAGSCTDWRPIPMGRTRGGRWEITTALPPGECVYSYLVDGAPLTPPEARRTRPDGFGGTNGVILVE